jgi:hypothetical protein
LKLLCNCSHNQVVSFRLLTPPGTPLFPSLEVESKRSPVSQAGTPKTRPTALKSRVSHLNIRCTLVLGIRSLQLYKTIISSIPNSRSSRHKVGEIPPHGGYETVLYRLMDIVISDFLWQARSPKIIRCLLDLL